VVIEMRPVRQRIGPFAHMRESFSALVANRLATMLSLHWSYLRTDLLVGVVEALQRIRPIKCSEAGGWQGGLSTAKRYATMLLLNYSLNILYSSHLHQSLPSILLSC